MGRRGVGPFLLDVNVLIAMTWPSHVHHVPVRRWFRESAAAGWATCPVTQLGFVRVSSNPRIISDAVSPAAACNALQRLTEHRHHDFWAEGLDMGRMGRAVFDRVMGHRQTTDAYLLALALSNGGQLATLDRAISALLPPEAPAEAVFQIGT